MRVAIKQPYFMPYIGYFQLMKYADVYVVYDDVNYYKGGYINRNKILINESTHYLTIPVKDVSHTKLINEVEIFRENKLYKNFLKTISMSYKKAPYFDSVFPMLQRIINSDSVYISELIYSSFIEIAKYLELTTKIILSSNRFSTSRGIGREERLIHICSELGADEYISESTGLKIYSKVNFKKKGIDFIVFQPVLPTYQQFDNEFVSPLSIIDVLMFNSVSEVNNMLDMYIVE